MRVAMISPYPAVDVPPRGGVEVSTSRLVEGLTAHGVQVEIISTGTPARATRNGIVVHRAPARRLTTARLLRPWRRDVRRILSDLSIDLVHGQGLMPPGVAATDVPAVRCPRVVTAHGNRRQDVLSHYAGPGARARSVLVDRLSATATRRADLVVGVHPDWHVNVPVEPRRYEFVPNIVEEVFFEADRRPRPARVLYCGGANAIKGWELLAEAWPSLLEEVPSAHLVGTRFAPGTPSDAHRIPEAEIRGWLTAEELSAEFELADVVVMPSRFEVAPVLMTEAWAAGVPVVAAAVGGIPGMANGAALVVEREPRAFARAIADVLLRRVDVDALVREGRARADPCRRENVIGAYLQLYRDLVA